MGPRENPPAIPDALFDRSAFAKGQPAGSATGRSALPQKEIRKSPHDEFDRTWANRSSHVKA